MKITAIALGYNSIITLENSNYSNCIIDFKNMTWKINKWKRTFRVNSFVFRILKFRYTEIKWILKTFWNNYELT